MRYWCFEPFPVIVVVYDADKQRAYWLHIQDYVEHHPGMMDSDADSVTLRIPIHNKLTVYAVDRFRDISLRCTERFRAEWENGR